jgi:DNA-directed RNA polymerase-3 subunit RPC5
MDRSSGGGRLPHLPVADTVSSAVDTTAMDIDGANSIHDDDDDDDDEVIREIPVYLSPDLSQRLQLIQYPLQQHETQPATLPLTARIKPRHCMLELEFPIPENIELNGGYHLASRTYSSQTIPIPTHMALGKMMPIDNTSQSLGLHLVPLSRITQLRPNFSHVDEEDVLSGATTEDELKQQQDETKLPDRKPVSFQKKESERAAIARKSSYGFKKASEDSEIWHPLEVHGSTSTNASDIMAMVKCPNPNRDLLQPSSLLKNTTATTAITARSLNERYVATLNYLPAVEESDEMMGIVSSATSGERRLKNVVARLVRIMHLGWPIPFSLIRAKFADKDAVSDEDLLTALGSCAVMVRGNFCLASRFMPMPQAIAQARTFLLFLFQSMKVVHRERVERVYESQNINGTHSNGNRGRDDTAVTPAVIGMLLEELGEKTADGWVLKVDDDETFGEKYPDALIVHVQYWARQLENFRPLLRRYRENTAEIPW